MIEEKLTKLKDYTLLLVEDDNELLNKLNIILGIFFKEVITATNGSDALELLKISKVDMIIADYNMPIMSGYDLFKQVRQFDKNIPLVIISNYSDSRKLLNLISLNLTDYLIKPIEYSTLTTTLISMIEKIDSNCHSMCHISDTLVYDGIKRVLKDGEIIIPLSKTEIVTIELLFKNKNKIVSNNEIEMNINYIDNMSSQAMKSLIYRLRKKLGKDTILNIPAFGYMLKTK